MNLNKVFLIGRVASDIELLTTQTGRKVCRISLATNRYWKGQDGSKREEATFHSVVLWERLADVVNSYSSKGSVLLIEGRIQNRSYEDKEGRKRYISEVIAENVQLGPRASSQVPGKKTEEREEELPVIDEDEIDIKDIPF